MNSGTEPVTSPVAQNALRNTTLFYGLYVVVCVLITSALNIVHSRYVLNLSLTAESFVIPALAGAAFGFALAHIQHLSRRLTEMAYTDPLTHIYNRLHFDNFLETEIDQAKRYGSTFSIIFFDIDHFKQINDQYGHLVGDEVLKELTAVVTQANRTADIFARYGGEEFIILATATNLEGAHTHAQRLREGIEQHHFDHVGTITCSFGVTEFKPESDDLVSLVKRADTVLYKAKDRGRNCVVEV